MTMPIGFDLSPTPRRETAERILSVATPLFDAVKSSPLSGRAGFPQVLRNNNFGLAVRATKTHALLEVTTKLRSQRSREADRLQAYRQIFTSIDSGEPAIFGVKARLLRFSGFTAEAPHAFALGPDTSMCAWDVRSTDTRNLKKQSYDLDVIYVVGYGRSIREADSWQEFDTLIRVTLSEWSGIR